jgi:hypothetical protein
MRGGYDLDETRGGSEQLPRPLREIAGNARRKVQRHDRPLRRHGPPEQLEIAIGLEVEEGSRQRERTLEKAPAARSVVRTGAALRPRAQRHDHRARRRRDERAEVALGSQQVGA